MSLNQPIGEQIAQSSIGNMKESLGNVVQDFSSKSVGDSSVEFLQSNSIIAKFVFLILVLIVVMILLNLGIYLIGYFLVPDRNPYVVKGVSDGNKKMVITQDPTRSRSATIYRSQNENKGAEFTWTCWLNIASLPSDNAERHIFNKGDGVVNGANYNASANAPGMYLQKDGNTAKIIVKMETMDGTEPIEIKEVPLNRWFNIAIRLQNKILDVYINGAIAMRKAFANLPKQNYGDIFVCQGGGFDGQLSDLRYFDSALTVFNLTNITMAGPNMTRAQDPAPPDTTFDYLSSAWYK